MLAQEWGEKSNKKAFQSSPEISICRGSCTITKQLQYAAVTGYGLLMP